MRAITENGMDKPKLISMISNALMPLELTIKRHRGGGDATSGGKGTSRSNDTGDDEAAVAAAGVGVGAGEGDNTAELRRGREGPPPCEGEKANYLKY